MFIERSSAIESQIESDGWSTFPWSQGPYNGEALYPIIPPVVSNAYFLWNRLNRESAGMGAGKTTLESQEIVFRNERVKSNSKKRWLSSIFENADYALSDSESRVRRIEKSKKK